MAGAARALLRLPVARELLRLGELLGRHLARHLVAALGGGEPARRLVEARGGEIEPHVRLHQALLHALAARIGEAEIVLRLAVALLGRALIPACRLVVVL